MLLRNEVRKTIVEGNDVCVIYDFVTDTAVGAVLSAEWITVDRGRIRSIRLIFQSLPWPAVVEELTRRASLAAGQAIVEPGEAQPFPGVGLVPTLEP